MSHYRILLGLTLVIASCGIKHEKSPPLPVSPCHRLKIQEKSWTPSNARTLISCLVRDADWSTRIEALEEKHFQETARWLNSKNKMLRSVALFKNLDAGWGPILKDPHSHTLLNYGNLQKLFQFSAAVYQNWGPHFKKNRDQYRNLLLEIFNLPLSQADQVRFLRATADIFSKLPVDKKYGQERWDELLFSFLDTVAGKEEIQAAFSRVAPHVSCQNLSHPDRFAVRTTSPLELGVQLFQRPQMDPDLFVETFQQGYLFWKDTCRSEPGIERSDVRILLNFALDHFDLLREVSAMGWNQSTILSLGEVFEMGRRSREFSTESVGGAVDLLARSEALRLLFREMAQNPVRARNFIDHAPLETMAYEVFASVARNPEIGAGRLYDLWLGSWDLLSEFATEETLLLEWQEVLAQLGPEATKGFGDAIETGNFQKSMNYLGYLLNGMMKAAEISRSLGLTAEPPPELAPRASHIPPARNDVYDELRARRLVQYCLSDHLTIAQSLECMKKNKARVFTPSARWIPHFTADWEVLYLLREFPMEFLLDPKTVSSFWRPMLDGLHLPPKDAKGLVQWFAQGSELSPDDQELMMSLGRRLFTALMQAEVPPENGGLKLLDPKLFKIQDSMQTMKPEYFASMIFALLGDPKYLETRRSFYRLARTQVQIENQHPQPMITSIDQLLSNFKIPFLSRSSSLAFALSSTNKLKNDHELMAWMDSTLVLLGRAEWALSFLYKKDEEPRKSVHLAQGILGSLKANAKPEDLWNIFKWIRDFQIQGQRSEDNLAFLMMIHEMGFLQSIQELYEKPPAWLTKGLSSKDPAETAALKETSSWIAETLLEVFKSLDDKELYELAVLNQLSTRGKFMSWTIAELGDLVMSPEFKISPQGKAWLHVGIRKLGPPPLKSPEILTPLLTFVRLNRTEFQKVLKPETLKLAAEIQKWKGYPTFIEFLTSPDLLPEWFELMDWAKTGVPLQLWHWSLRLERRSLDPQPPEPSAKLTP
jgi:hypothetical protein